MQAKRVAITGMGAISPFGTGVTRLADGIAAKSCAITSLPEGRFESMTSHVVALVPEIESRRISRDLRRTMSPMSVFACLAAWEALAQAGLEVGSPEVAGAGVAIGSTLGSPSSLHDFFSALLVEKSLDEVRSTTFFKVMSHSVAANVAQACQCRGRTIAPSAACATGLVGIALGYEAIACGREKIMLCGGADEFHLLVAATFEKLGAASGCTIPELASRPFDRERSGIVCAEGAGVLVLEDLEQARARGATILAEVTGAAICSSPTSIAHPDQELIAQSMQMALADAGVQASDIAFVNAHATGTEFGDQAEGQAIARVFGSKTPISSLKGHLGHTMAASGAIESIMCVEMLRRSMYFPTHGLKNPDPACGNCNFLQETMPANGGPVLKNSFALGGVNCSVVFSR